MFKAVLHFSFPRSIVRTISINPKYTDVFTVAEHFFRDNR